MQPKNVLEIGCGDGFFIGSLSKIIPDSVGVDLSKRAISFAKAFHPNCKFFETDAAELKEQFDVVAAIEVLEHIPDEQIPHFLSTIYNRLDDKGTAVISVPSDILPVTRKHYRHYNLNLLEQQILDANCKLKVVNVEYVYRDPWWGNLLRRFADNKYFKLEINWIMKLAWRNLWNSYRTSDAEHGRHLVAYLKKEI